MKTIELSKIIIPPRQREKHEPSHIQALKTSILNKGLMHPLLLSQKEDSTLELVAGYGRYLATSELGTERISYFCDRDPIELGYVPYILISDLSPADLAEAELEENILRANLTWMEEVEARKLIFELRQRQAPESTVASVGREIAEKSGKTEIAERDKLLRSLAVAEHKNNPRIKNAKSLYEAFRAVQDMNAASLRRDLVSRGMVKTNHQVILGDCRAVLPTLADNTFDTILCDPPYGIKADEFKKSAMHLYEDDTAYGLEINKLILREGFRLLKPKGIVFLFCDVEHFLELRNYANAQAYATWRTPIIWQKGIEGHAPWGRAGFIRTYEMLAFFTKGAKELKGGGPDIKEFKRPARNERGHAAEKPESLLSHLLSVAGDAGDFILDPCCGSGPILDAATSQRMTATAIELDPDYHALAVARLVKAPEEQPEFSMEAVDELLA